MTFFTRRSHWGIAPLASTFVIAVCLSIVAVDGWRTYRTRDIQLHEGEVAANNLARAIAQHATDVLKESDAIVLGLVDRLQSEGTQAASIERVEALMSRYAAGFPQLERLSIIDEKGHWIATSLLSQDATIDVSELGYFKHHQADASRDAHIGPPIQSTPSGQWVVTLSRRFNHADGRFGGVVLASIDLDYFRQFYESLEIGTRGSLTLATKEGLLLDRRPFHHNMIGSDLSGTALFRNHVAQVNEGFVLQVSSIDHVERQIAFKSLDEYPLWVTAGLSTAETLAGWKADAILHTVFVALLVTALGFSGFWIVGQIKERSDVELKLLNYQAELELLNRQLATMAREDGLTKLVNRRELDRVLIEEISRAERTHAPLGLVLLDVDFFKLFNDRYGHPSGDECLRKVAAILAEYVRRPGDLAARYGGEEFAVVLPGADAAGAAAVAEKICQGVRALSIEHAGSPRGILTISAGVAVLVSNGSQTSLDALIRFADTALYSAKRNGRDMVGLYEPLSVCANPPLAA